MVDDRYRANAEAYIAGVIKADNPDISVDGAGVSSLIVKPGGAIASAFLQELEHTRSARDISDPEAISEEDMDLNLSTLLVPRLRGLKSTGPVNIHFTTRTRKQLTAGTRVSTRDQQYVYVLDNDLVFEEFDFIANPDDGTYYARATFSAENEGESYDLDIGQINTIIDNNVGASYVRNPERFQSGEDAQSNTDYLRYVGRGVSVRTPVVSDGATFTVQQLFGLKVLDVLNVGNGDSEMLRDELHRQADGTLDLLPTGTPTGIHIGGRSDIYHWYKRVNYIEVTIDLSTDLVLISASSVGASSITAGFTSGATAVNAVPQSGKLVIELGAGREETVQYTSWTFNTTTQQYTFQLATTLTQQHSAQATVKIAGDGRVAIGPGTKIDRLPVLRVQSVQLLDPLTLSPVGDLVPKTTAASRKPGWYISDINKFNHLSAKETKTLVIDEKVDVDGNSAVHDANGVTNAGSRTLSSSTVDFTGRNGQIVTLTFADGTKRSFPIIGLLSSTSVFLGPDGVIPTESGVTIDIASQSGDYLQYAIRVGYYTHVEAMSLQEQLDAPRKRVVTSNILSRLFYPVFLDFKLRYKGTGTETDVREAILRLIQQSQGNALGENDGARFEASDIIAAAYEDNLATYVEMPFEIKVTTVHPDQEDTVSWISPSIKTVVPMVISTSSSGVSVYVRARFPTGFTPVALPSSGKIFLGVFENNKEVVTYNSFFVAEDGQYWFMLDAPSIYTHQTAEPLSVTVTDYDPANVITDGVISADRIHRPYFGVFAVEKIQ